MVEEGERFQLPMIRRQRIVRWRDDQPSSIPWRAGIFKEIVGAELMQVEIASILHDDEGDGDGVERPGGAARQRAGRPRLAVEHQGCEQLTRPARGRLLLEALHDPDHPLLELRPPDPLEGRVGDVAHDGA